MKYANSIMLTPMIFYYPEGDNLNEPRNVAIYFMKHLRCDTLKDVGKFFGIKKNSTISSVDSRLKREMIKDKQIKKTVEALKLKLSKGQE